MKIILIGAGGHAVSCVSCLESAGIGMLGFLDRPEFLGHEVSGYPIIGTDDDIGRFVDSADGFLVAVGQIEHARMRERLYGLVQAVGGIMPVIRASDAWVDRLARIGDGSIAMHRSFINAGASIGCNCIINSGAIIEHDVVIGDHVHVSTGAIINGACRVGRASFIGSGAVVRNNVTIGSEVIIGAGSVVVKDVLEPGVYAGAPVRRIK